jgi:hypothetical protein
VAQHYKNAPEIAKQIGVATHVGLGDNKRAIDAMEQAYRGHAGNDIALVKVDPMLPNLRGKVLRAKTTTTSPQDQPAAI